MANFFKEVGAKFVEHYYTTFDSNKAGLCSLYVPESLMTFEGQEFQGTTSIMEKLNAMPFKKIQHIVTSSDFHPILTLDNSTAVFVQVMGQLKTDEDPPHSFVQSFILRPAQNSYVIANDVFRMVLHNA